MFTNSFSEEIYNTNYRFGDESLDDTFLRIAKELASIEGDNREEWTEKFHDLLKDFKLVPGGRIVANAGTGLKNVSFLNCFVSGPTGYDIDSLHSINDEIKRQMAILASEGGYGVCADFMRPRGAYIRGVGVESPGAVRFLDIWDTSSDVITSGSGRKLDRKGGKRKSRRGAQMVTMSCWHPDIMEFITAKQTPGRLSKFNMSVLITDDFMTAVKENKPWDLIYPDYEIDHETYKREWSGDIVKWIFSGYSIKVYHHFDNANELWSLIMKSTYNRNEPGVLFIDTINRMNNLQYCEYISATNPCLAGGTLILTDRGQRLISELVGNQFNAIVDGQVYPSTEQGFWQTGVKQLYKYTLANGLSIRATANHKFMINGEWKEIGEAKIGDTLQLTEQGPILLELFLDMFVRDYMNKVSRAFVENDGGIMLCNASSVKHHFAKNNCEHLMKQNTLSRIELDTIEPVYDCTIPKIHRFSANGFIVHNCGEEPLPCGGVCLLGSFNLTQFINTDVTDFDYEKLKTYIPIAIRMLDNVNDISAVPLLVQKENMQQKRRIGLGHMGYGSALMMMKLRYGSTKAIEMTDKFLDTFANLAYQASSHLAKEKGSFPLFDREKYLNSPFIKTLWPETQELIAKYGIRNSHLLSVQPTGTSSILANNVSGGLEPIFLTEYIRTTIFDHPPEGLIMPSVIFWGDYKYDGDQVWNWIKEGGENLLTTEYQGYTWKIDKNRGLLRETLNEDYAVRTLKTKGEWEPQADWAATTSSLNIDDHVNTLSVFARHVDSAISKTCNLPADYPYEDFQNLYMKAYQTGVIKGITTYRDGTMTSVLAEVKPKTAIPKVKAPPRPDVLECDIDLIRMGSEKWLVLVGLLEGQPFEVFALKPKHIIITDHVKKGRLRKITEGDYNKYNLETDYFIVEDLQLHFEHPEEESLTRMISTALKHGADINYIYEQLEKAKGTIVSFSKAIARSLAKYVTEVSNKKCESCNVNDALVFQEGCVVCKFCGVSKCG